MAFQNPSVADFKSQFVRDFPYGTDPNKTILDSDIAYAFQMTNMNVNQGLFPDQGSYGVGYNLLAAHYLVSNIRSSSQGINGQYDWLQNSKAVGNVNEAFTIPPTIANNPFLASLSKTNYGQQYLMLVYPQLASKGMFAAYMPAHAL